MPDVTLDKAGRQEAEGKRQVEEVGCLVASTTTAVT